MTSCGTAAADACLPSPTNDLAGLSLQAHVVVAPNGDATIRACIHKELRACAHQFTWEVVWLPHCGAHTHGAAEEIVVDQEGDERHVFTGDTSEQSTDTPTTCS